MHIVILRMRVAQVPEKVRKHSAVLLFLKMLLCRMPLLRLRERFIVIAVMPETAGTQAGKRLGYNRRSRRIIGWGSVIAGRRISKKLLQPAHALCVLFFIRF